MLIENTETEAPARDAVKPRERKTRQKHSYAVPCSSAFRDRVSALAERRGVNVGDLARSVMLLVPAAALAGVPDPGGPDDGDRETVVLKSGPSAGKPWRRKPRLQARLPAGYEIEDLRRALGLALALDAGEVEVTLEDGGRPKADERLKAADDEIERLRMVVVALSFEPLKNGVRTRNDALYVLGFPTDSNPDSQAVNARFRMLATIHHPDGAYGDHGRMSQLNQAVAKLRTGAG
jgi:hypothetical protein